MKEIEEGNKLIAEFMGGSYETELDSIWGKLQESGHRNPDLMNDPKNYKYYHSSWDWLMSVIEKIEALTLKTKEENRSGVLVKVIKNFTVEISGVQCMIHNDILPQFYGTEKDFLNLYDCRNTSKIEATYMGIIEFIKWYNINKKPVIQ